MIGVYSKFQKCFNALKPDDISGAVRNIYEHEERIEEAIGLRQFEDGKVKPKNVGKFLSKVLEYNIKESQEEN